MTAMKKTYETNAFYQHQQAIHSIQAADYSDVVTEEYFAEIEAVATPMLEAEEWTMVDGPAW